MGFFSPDTITDFVRRGDIEGVKRRLELGDNVNECRSFQRTPLLEAALYNHCAIIELLLDHGADMELIDSCDFTALHKAIERSVEAALLLTRRGADANKVGYRDQTPLQTAVLRDLFDVTAELLRHGADPTIRNNGNYRARDFVQRGLNHDKFIKLLDAYTDLKSAIGAMNEDAITVWLRKALTGIPTSTISGIEAAIVLMRTDAMCAILQATLARGDFDDMVQKHKSMENGIRDASDADWHKSLVVAGDDYKMKWLEKVILSQDFGQLLTFIESVASPDWMQSVLFNNGWTPLHYAASLGNSAFVQYLLVECGLNPLALSSDNKTARDLAVEAGSSNDLSWMLQRHMKKRTFSDHSALLLLGWKEVTVDGLQQLLGQLTSVYDLRIIFSLGCQALTPDEMHGILTEDFDEVIREKLVFDDHAALFFKMGLKECRREKFISDAEKMEWCLKTTKVNVENSDWVREIKQSLQELECRATVAERNVELLSSQFGALRDALIEREKCEINRRRRRRYISLLSAALIMCGGGVIKEVFESAFNLWNPEKLLSALSADRMADFLADETTTLIFKDGVQAILQDAAVDPVEFAVVLRDAIHLERAEPVTLETPMLPPSDPEPVNPLFPPKNVNTFRAAVHSVMQRDTPNEDEDTPDHPSAGSSSSEVIVSSASSTTSTIDSQMSEAEMEAHPYHYAVRFSGGDFDQFQELAQYIKQDDGDINETLTMHVRLVAPDGKLNERETMEASALTYASYLGYTEIVKWFLEREDVVKTEKSFLTVKRSRNSLKNVNEVCIPTCSA